jgi:zinc/manganese transport system substrate-binding protein
MFRRSFAVLALSALLFAPGAAAAAEKLKAIASFSIIGDMVERVAGDRVELLTLVGPDVDAHVYQPKPDDAKALAAADLLFVNGLGFEGWMERLQRSSGFKGKVVETSRGVETREMLKTHGHGHGAHNHDHGHGEHDHNHDHKHDEAHAKHDHDHHHDHDHDHVKDEEKAALVTDPHAWQSLANGKVYAANIRDALIAADPEGRETYEANAAAYMAEMDALDAEVREAVAKLPAERRRIITSHDAFGYFGAAYGLEFIAPEGVSTESEASAQDVARIIRQIREEKVPAVFMENVPNQRLLDQIARETGVKIGGTLYSDALSGPDGPVPSYLDMFRHNMAVLSEALSS